MLARPLAELFRVHPENIKASIKFNLLQIGYRIAVSGHQYRI